MGASGPRGLQGPQGPQGPRGEPAVADPNVVAQTLSTQTQFLNSLAKTITADTNIGSVQHAVVTKIMQSPTALSNTIAQNQVFQNLVGQSLINESSALGNNIANGIIADPANTLQLVSSIVSQGSFLSDLSKTLSDPNLPYAEYIRGPPGSIANIKAAIQPISVLCDTVGNCKTPQLGSYLNFTNGNLLFNNNKGIPAFRVAGDGGPWITGNSGGQLGTYNDNTNTGTVAIKWDAQGNVIVGDITQTTGSLKVGGTLNVTGNINFTGTLYQNSSLYYPALPPGFIIQYAASSAPSGWLLCDGSAVSRTTYSALFAIISTTHGSGDGSTTFNLPDLRGRVAVGAGQGSGLTNRIAGSRGGAETHTLTTSEMPSHNHSINDPGHRHDTDGSNVLRWQPGYADRTAPGGNDFRGINPQIYASTTGISINNAGGNGAHNNMQPFTVINFIIKV
jgi:microcystin-dependent protein